MNNTIKSNIPEAVPSFVREYEIDGIKYIVSSTIKEGAKETAVSKIRRLIRKEINNFS